MMSDLEVKTTVNEFDILGTHYVHRCSELTRRERLCRSQVIGGASEMR